ncbi:Solute carrier organic anion transporter family member 3A1 [Chelonia mydas]|uniref:Solute carrier organic anion transporter family member 3A1 n=1 Tax=Chelonia mydas TaxID=8469 RepID=M7C455_CHEMY|nr:Solute carrier organic anion transporter family member 3A1 [Chelonia mydas]
MQGKKPGGPAGGGGELQGDEAQGNKKRKKKVSCFSNIKIFLVSECALMLAQGTVGAYLGCQVSSFRPHPRACIPSQSSHPARTPTPCPSSEPLLHPGPLISGLIPEPAPRPAGTLLYPKPLPQLGENE